MEHGPKCECFDLHELAGVDKYSCGCCENHTPQTTPSEEWATGWRPYAEWFALLGRVEKITTAPMDAAGTERGIKLFIEKTRTAAYEKGVRDSLEALDEIARRRGFNSVREEVREAISTLLT